MSSLKISIVVCTYNNAASLRRTLSSLESLRIPTGLECELCLIDNNSKDDTHAAWQAYADKLPFPTRYFFESKQGLSHARNRGIAEASGDFLVFTDDDVVVPANWMELYAQTILAHGADAVFGKIIPEWDGPAPPFFKPELNPAYALLDYGDKSFVVADRALEFYGANFGCLKSRLLAVGSFDAKLGRTKGFLFVGEERQVFLSLMDLGATVVYNPSIVVRHVIAENRKRKAYLRKYYKDIAASLVYLADQRARRTLLGIPLFRIKECASFFILLVPRTIGCLLPSAKGRLFILELKTRMFARMTAIYFQRALRLGRAS
jgi:glycosyltransferase involved in cell wall biosynthesis